jgi:hypothetical protein
MHAPDQPPAAFPAELMFGGRQLGRFSSDLSAHLSYSYPNYASGLIGSKSTSKLGADNMIIMDSLDTGYLQPGGNPKKFQATGYCASSLSLVMVTAPCEE